MSEFPKREAVYYWRCSRGHRHPTLELANGCEARLKKKQAGAASCVERQEAAKAKRTARYKLAFMSWGAGNSWVEVGRIVGRVENPSKPIHALTAKYLADRWLCHCRFEAGSTHYD